MRITNGIVYGPDGRFHTRELYINPETGLFSSSSLDERVWDASGCFLIPGLTDLHFHGCAGSDLCDANPEALQQMAIFEAAHGVTNICPASMTLPEEALEVIYRNAAAYRRQAACRRALHQGRAEARLVGIHMEGPFLSPKRPGSQNRRWMQNPDAAMARRLQEASGGLLRQVDVAPELPGALEFIEELKDTFRISLAHSNATFEEAIRAFQAGATQVTHLYNAMSPMTHRAPGLVGAALDQGDCFVELIGDGIHVSPPMLRNTWKMFGKDRIILISDSLRATGMPPGEYELGGQTVQVRGRQAVLAGTNTLAGSISHLLDCLRCVVREARIPLEYAVQSAAVNPVRSLGLEDQLGSIQPGKRAQLVCLDRRLNLRAVWMEHQWAAGPLK